MFSLHLTAQYCDQATLVMALFGGSSWAGLIVVQLIIYVSYYCFKKKVSQLSDGVIESFKFIIVMGMKSFSFQNDGTYF